MTQSPLNLTAEWGESSCGSGVICEHLQKASKYMAAHGQSCVHEHGLMNHKLAKIHHKLVCDLVHAHPYLVSLLVAVTMHGLSSLQQKDQEEEKAENKLILPH